MTSISLKQCTMILLTALSDFNPGQSFRKQTIVSDGSVKLSVIYPNKVSGNLEINFTKYTRHGQEVYVPEVAIKLLTFSTCPRTTLLAVVLFRELSGLGDRLTEKFQRHVITDHVLPEIHFGVTA